ncbi:lipoprotein [Planoprotostelium fungivorum]|uniref:Lipoprotein n=1 Tax=Planoprotostelium fungivorum TaxID=1890364 RepID=A0A2P6N218_9EUKA|nr:lipoprotein [Planoprotostelium fungivorum]
MRSAILLFCLVLPIYADYYTMAWWVQSTRKCGPSPAPETVNIIPVQLIGSCTPESSDFTKNTVSGSQFTLEVFSDAQCQTSTSNSGTYTLGTCGSSNSTKVDLVSGTAWPTQFPPLKATDQVYLNYFDSSCSSLQTADITIYTQGELNQACRSGNVAPPCEKNGNTYRQRICGDKYSGFVYGAGAVGGSSGTSGSTGSGSTSGATGGTSGTTGTSTSTSTSTSGATDSPTDINKPTITRSGSGVESLGISFLLAAFAIALI